MEKRGSVSYILVLTSYLFYLPVGGASQKEIWRQADLAAIGLTDDCILMADITITSPIDPIGSESAPFSGSFEGNNHKITNLRIVDGKGTAGLFGAVTGRITNLTLVDPVVISSGGNVGGIVGLLLPGGTVYRCAVKGGVVAGTAAGSDAGGLVGQNAGGVIEECFTTCNVVGSTVGGVVGSMVSRQTSQALYRSQLLNSFSTSSVLSKDGPAGGLVGDSSEFVVYCYADCQDTIAAGGQKGAIVGATQSSAFFMGCFYAADMGLSPSGNPLMIPGVAALPRSQMVIKDTFLKAGWNPEVWGFPLGQAPRLRWAGVKPVAVIKGASSSPILNPSTSNQVILDASESYDPDGDQLMYVWSWGGHSKVVSEPNLVMDVADLAHGQNLISLTVTDGVLDSDPASITVWVDRPPLAKVMASTRWLDPTKTSAIYLYGAGSFDPDNDELSYIWSWSGWQASTGRANWIEIPASQLVHGENLITLIVEDGILSSEPASITVVKNTPPTASISGDAVIVIGPRQDLTVDAANTFDPDGDPVSYTWSVNGSIVVANTNDSSVTIPAAMFDQRMNLLSVTVHDGMAGYVPSTAIVNVRVNVPPVVDAGQAQVIYSPVDSNLSVVLQGTASDEDGDVLTCRWLEGNKPIATGLSTSVALPVGFHSVTLEASDGFTLVGDVVDINIVGPLPAKDLKVSPATIGRTSQCNDVKFYLLMPKGMSVSDLDLGYPMCLYLDNAHGQSVEVGQLARDDNYSQKRQTLVGVISRQKLLNSVGPENGRKTLKLSVRMKSGRYLLAVASIEVVPGSGPDMLSINAERLRYWLELP